MQTLDIFLGAAIEIQLGVEMKLIPNAKQHGQLLLCCNQVEADKMKESYNKGELGVKDLKKFKRQIKELRDRIDEQLLI